ncbi:hypothetical protein WMW72_10580 [Paenibacillus filicis]|uniref:Uncharacterized protein n=1 Tax=Paenibacillus filicis TaxID=669464 RepID=A0ABU9DHJ4_9BACL
MADRVWVRQFLKDNGYGDNDIGYDGSGPSGRVTLQGRTFDYATPDSDGMVRGTYDSMNKALNNFRQQGLQNNFNQTSDQIRQAAQAAARQFKAPEPFKYDQNSDPAYQAALNTARANITQQQADTNARLRAGGQGKSSYSETVANQIGAKEMARVSDTVLPQLINQAYQRYQDSANRDLALQQANYGAEQDRIANLAKSYAQQFGQYQQQFDNDRAIGRDAAADKSANWQAYLQSAGLTGNLGSGPKVDWSLLGGNDGARTLQGQEFDASQQNALFNRALQEAGLTGTYNGSPTMQQRAQDFSQSAENRRIGLQAQGQSQSAANAKNSNDLAWARFNADKDPNSLDNQYKQAQIDSLKGKSGKVDYQKNPGYSEDLTFIYDNPKTAVTEIQKNVQSLIAEYGQDGYNALLKEAQRVQRAAEKK